MSDTAEKLELPASSRDALAAGLTLYFTGKACKHGHIAPRQATNATCIECRLAAGRQWAAAHPEEIAAFREQAKPLIRQKAREYRLSHPDVLNERTRQWRKANPVKRRANEQKRRARKRGAEGYYTQADIEAITKRQNGRCACCNKPKRLTVDHIKPLSKGGSNWPRNIQMLCLRCNQKKHAKDPIEFMQSMGALL